MVVDHPSGLEDKDEIIEVSAEFYSTVAQEMEEAGMTNILEHLLTFQQGWKACKDAYKINT